MKKTLLLFGLSIAALPVAQRHPNFPRLRAIEAYEVRPGVLMLPKYATDGRICEIGLEKLHHQDDTIDVDSDLTELELNAIADDLVPARERGPKLDLPMTGVMSGQSLETLNEYENISIRFFAPVSEAPSIRRSDKTAQTSQQNWVAATIIWKHRPCSHQPPKR